MSLKVLVFALAQTPHFAALPPKRASLGVERYRFYRSVADGLFALDDTFDTQSLSSLGEAGGLAKVFFPVGKASSMVLFQQENGEFRLIGYELRGRTPREIWRTKLLESAHPPKATGTLGRDRASNNTVPAPNASTAARKALASKTCAAGYWIDKSGGLTCEFLTPRSGKFEAVDSFRLSKNGFPITSLEERYLARARRRR